MPPLLVGFVAGVMLAALRAPLGVELFQIPATAAATAYGFRAAALGAIALGIAAAASGLGKPLSAGRLILGTALGFGYRGLAWEKELGDLLLFATLLVLTFGLSSFPRPGRPILRGMARGALAAALLAVVLIASEAERPGAMLAFGVLGLGAMVLAGRSTLFASRPQGAVVPEIRPERPAHGELTGLALAGAGTAIALDGVARHLRLLGGGLAQDDAVFGTLFLLFASAGAAAFLLTFRSSAARALGPGISLAACAVVTFASLRAIGNLASPRGLDRYLKDGWARAISIDISDHGTLLYDLAVAAPVIALPAVLFGAGLRAMKSPLQLSAVLLGGAVGTVVAPLLLGSETGVIEIDGVVAGAHYSAALIPAGAKLGALGALFAIVLGHGLRRGSTISGAAACLVLAGAAFLLPAPRTPVLSPWAIRPAIPRLVVDTPEGLLTVEPTEGGVDAVTLDRRELSPRREHAELDRTQIEAAWSLLPLRLRTGNAARVLLVGQLTPGRSISLSELGAACIDRTGSWHLSMPLLERELFGPFPLPAGDVLAPSEARARLAGGDYDLILVPPVPGDAPSTRNLGWPLTPEDDAPRRTIAVVWLDTRSSFAHLPLSAQVLPATADLTELALGIVYGRASEDEGTAIAIAPSSLSAGPPLARPDPIDRLLLRRDERLRENRAAVARRLAGANADGPAAALTSGLAHFFAEQRRSSGYENRASQIELSREALDELREAALAADEPDPFLRQVIEAAAAILRGKRWVEEIGEYLEPIAARHTPWPALEEALAYADLELLDPQAAAERMGRLLASVVGTPERWALHAEALARSGRTREAAESFWRALELAPDNRVLRRRLAIQLVLAGDPEGQAMVRDLLLELPEDEELKPYLGDGPYPEPPQGYGIAGGAHDAHGS